MTPRKKATKNPANPLCGAIIRKTPDQQGGPCPNEAEFVINIVDPDDPDRIRISAVLLLCKRHADKFDSGSTVVAMDNDGNLIMAKAEDYTGK